VADRGIQNYPLPFWRTVRSQLAPGDTANRRGAFDLGLGLFPHAPAAQAPALPRRIPRICSWCRKVCYDDQWLKLEDYFNSRFSTHTSHDMCPECLKKKKEELALKRQSAKDTGDMKYRQSLF
jgi:hypothetical protein